MRLQSVVEIVDTAASFREDTLHLLRRNTIPTHRCYDHVDPVRRCTRVYRPVQCCTESHDTYTTDRIGVDDANDDTDLADFVLAFYLSSEQESIMMKFFAALLNTR